MQLQRPFLKWAGGKTRLVPAIRALLPAEAKRLIEPFVGSGAVALNLGLPALLADANEDLVAVYRELQRGGTDFIHACEKLFTASANSPATYYARREEFNTTHDHRRKACLFVYLNRHGYNGLCRYNAKGGFNVPFGRYVAPRLPRAAMLAFHAALQRCELERVDFRAAISRAGPGDFVYCDPPYVPVSATAHFTAYAAAGFTLKDQADLVAACRSAAGRGAHVVISNHDTPETRRLYADADERRALNVSRVISCKTGSRRPARELLVVFRPRRVQPSAA